MVVITTSGSGIMTTALATPLTSNGYEVRLVDTHLNRGIVTSIQETSIHPNLGLRVPDGVTAHQLEDAPRAFGGVELVMNGVNSFGADQAGDQFTSLLRPGIHVITLVKNTQADDGGSLAILSRALASRLPGELRSWVSVSVIAGPPTAGEVAVHRHTSVVSAGEDPEVLTCWRELFVTEHHHVWINANFVGVEVCAAMRNCYAFGVGFMQGLLDVMGETARGRYVNYNYGAALLGQASVEMIQFMELLGGKPTTPIGLPGIGNCFVTSMGGRNMWYGRLVGSGIVFNQARVQMPGTILEGVAAIAVIGRTVIRLTERDIVPPERFSLLRHLYKMVSLDQPAAVPWDSFFGDDGFGQV